MNLILLGPPGIGKGTQAEILSAKFSIPKISTGDMFREEIKRKTQLGQDASSYMQRGELVPDSIVMAIIRKRLSESDCRKGFVLDGFPRTLAQAEALEKITKIDLVLNLSASKKELIERMAGRLTCKGCGQIYHLKHSPPKKRGVCDSCRGELYQREDQKAEVLTKRIEVYEKQTKPLISYYRNKGILVDVDARGSSDKVTKNVEKALGAFMKAKTRRE
jgi:adenylate kinase